jgi:small subunit ribosomal protein S17
MKKTLTGVVTGDKNSKSRRVEVARLFRHPKYGKIVHGRTICHMHDENNESKAGDTVEIVECRPRSRTKRFELLRIVKRGEQVEVAGEV